MQRFSAQGRTKVLSVCVRVSDFCTQCTVHRSQIAVNVRPLASCTRRANAIAFRRCSQAKPEMSIRRCESAALVDFLTVGFRPTAVTKISLYGLVYVRRVPTSYL